MKTTREQFKKILKEELSEIQVSQQDFKNMGARDALRVAGGDDKNLRKAIADFITQGGEDRQEVLAQAIGSHQYSDPYLVNLARTLLGKALANSSPEKRIQVAKNVEKQMNEHLQNSRLKKLISEEVSRIMNEMAVDEMAFSMDDLSAATADVQRKDRSNSSLENGKKLYDLLHNLIITYNNSGGEAVIDPSVASRLPAGNFKPYHRNLAIIHKVLKGLSEKMFQPTGDNNWPSLRWNLGDPPKVRPGRDGHAQTRNHLNNLFGYLENIIKFARETSDQSAVGFEEPYLSADNAEQLETLVKQARADLKERPVG